MPNNTSLAQFIATRREKLNLTQEQLSYNANLTLKEIQSIEQGYELFLSATIRQKLAKALKIENKELKKYEVKADFSLVNNAKMDEIKEQILLNANNPNFEIRCPICNEKLITRIAKLYDLEDNLILRPKARCSKCPFQLID